MSFNPLTGFIASSVDRAFSRLAFRPGRQGTAEALGAEERIEGLERILAQYNDPRLLEEPDLFFERPPVPNAREEEPPSNRRGLSVVDLAWESGYEPFSSDVGEEYVSRKKNRTAHARLFLHTDRPRFTLILLHGYLGGTFTMERRLWSVDWFFDQGIDVALGLLPFHGIRGHQKPFKPPPFPNSDPRVTIEGFRQAIWDLRSLSLWLRDRGAPAIAVMGMSLGGYTAGLWATSDAELDSALLLCPLTSLADFAKDGGRLIGSSIQAQRQHELLEKVYRVVSPLGRPSAIPKGAALVFGGRADQITPVRHAERLADHLGARIEVFAGGHLLQFGRRRCFQSALNLFRRRGLLG